MPADIEPVFDDRKSGHGAAFGGEFGNEIGHIKTLPGRDAPVRLVYRVVVSRSGRLLSATLLGLAQPEAVMEAGRQALGRTQWQVARVRGEPISDWARTLVQLDVP